MTTNILNVYTINLFKSYKTDSRAITEAAANSITAKTFRHNH